MSNALDTHILRTQEAADALSILSLYIEDHGEVSPDDVNWANVGDMTRLRDQLREAVMMIRGLDEWTDSILSDAHLS